jgi:hypothetical protein
MILPTLQLSDGNSPVRQDSGCERINKLIKNKLKTKIKNNLYLIVRYFSSDYQLSSGIHFSRERMISF